MRAELYWIDLPDVGPGRLAIAPRPRGSEWLEDEVLEWRRAGVDRVVSLLTSAEEQELKLEGESVACRASGVRFTSCPVEDRDVPFSRQQFQQLAADLLQDLRTGRGILIHCRQGIGRSSLLAGATLVAAEMEPRAALAVIERARGRPVPDTQEQRAWLGAA